MQMAHMKFKPQITWSDIVSQKSIDTKIYCKY